MNDAISQLQNRLNDNSLRNDFLDYLRAFYVLPERILNSIEPPTYLLVRFNLYKWGFLFLPWVNAYPLKFSMEGFV